MVQNSSNEQENTKKVKKPKKIKIGSFTFNIEYESPPLKVPEVKIDTNIEESDEGDDTVYGYSCVSENKIVIDKSLSEEFTRNILLHEILHMIFDIYIVDEEDPIEKKIRILSPSLIQLFRDNKMLKDYLFKR